ncbi:MAG: hypothetical protein IPJ03_13740 [Ignavibacteriales bacterium]|nr:hypothetical protein [Ignavibacteriales bacterium]
MKKFILLTAVFFSVIVSAQVNVELLSHFNPYPSSGYNDIWGYVDPNGNEYALLGVGTGTSIINVTDPRILCKLHLFQDLNQSGVI